MLKELHEVGVSQRYTALDKVRVMDLEIRYGSCTENASHFKNNHLNMVTIPCRG